MVPIPIDPGRHALVWFNRDRQICEVSLDVPYTFNEEDPLNDRHSTTAMQPVLFITPDDISVSVDLPYRYLIVDVESGNWRVSQSNISFPTRDTYVIDALSNTVTYYNIAEL